MFAAGAQQLHIYIKSGKAELLQPGDFVLFLSMERRAPRHIQTKRALVKGKDKPISLMMVKSGCENQKEVIQLER
jgi:hypothetical protein